MLHLSGKVSHRDRIDDLVPHYGARIIFGTVAQPFPGFPVELGGFGELHAVLSGPEGQEIRVRSVEKHSEEWSVELQIPRLRSG